MDFSTKRFLIKIATKVIFFVAISIIAFTFIKSPVITNEIALGQMTNSNDLFFTLDLFNKLKPVINVAYGAITLFFVGSIGINIYKFFKEKK